jgi:hypothetical protein
VNFTIGQGKSLSTHLLNAHRAHLVSSLDTIVDAFPGNKRSKETASERIPSAIRINDVGNFVDRVYFWNIRFRG